MAESKTYRFKVTAPDGTTASSETFSWPPPDSAEVSAASDDTASSPSEGAGNDAGSGGSADSGDSAEVSAAPDEDANHAEVTAAES